jgi:hypothetical protein
VALFSSVLHNLAQISTRSAREPVAFLLAAGSAVVTNSMIGYGKAAAQQERTIWRLKTILKSKFPTTAI